MNDPVPFNTSALLSAVVERLSFQSGSTAAVEIEKSAGRHTVAGGKYSMAQHKITLYWEGIEEQCRLLYGSLKPIAQHAAAVFAHELGHAEDRQLHGLASQLAETADPLQKKRIALKIETNAWRYAQQLLQEEDEEFFVYLMHVSLEPYHEKTAS